MKILFFQWEAFMQIGIERALQRLKIDYFVYKDHIDDWDKDIALMDRVDRRLDNIDLRDIDTIFSVNFIPVIADLAKKRNLRYISWVYDCPLHFRRKESMKYKNNTIYFFDRMQAESYRKAGVDARHMPLAADAEVFYDTVERQDKDIMLQGNTAKKQDDDYICDVSLLGKLYKSDFEYLCTPLSQYNRGFMDGIINAQMGLECGYIIDDLVTDELIASLNRDYKKASSGSFQVIKDEITYTLAMEVTARRRFNALFLLQNRCRLNLYSNERDERLKADIFKGYADYYKEMPDIFMRSRINLNISLCAIPSGIPLRVLDVLSVGGFLITNMQPEVMEYFTADEDLVYYEDTKDLVMKVEYYLAHDDERKRIAANGQRKVRELFTFDDRIGRILG